MGYLCRVKMKDGKKFEILMSEQVFLKNDIIEMATIKMVVTKIRKFNLWRKLLSKIGFKFVPAELREI